MGHSERTSAPPVRFLPVQPDIAPKAHDDRVTEEARRQYITDAPPKTPRCPRAPRPKRKIAPGCAQDTRPAERSLRWGWDEGAFQRHQSPNQPIAPLAQGHRYQSVNWLQQLGQLLDCLWIQGDLGIGASAGGIPLRFRRGDLGGKLPAHRHILRCSFVPAPHAPRSRQSPRRHRWRAPVGINRLARRLGRPECRGANLQRHLPGPIARRTSPAVRLRPYFSPRHPRTRPRQALDCVRGRGSGEFHRRAASSSRGHLGAHGVQRLLLR